MDEFELIRRYFVRDGGAEGVVVGIGDDGAVLLPGPGKALVSVVDTLVESVHWPPELAAADVGFRAVAVNVSDVAAMGGRPRWMTLALTLTAADEQWLAGFARGLFEAADRYATALVGGDVTHGGQTVISVQVTGEVDPAHVLRRSGAKPGHRIYVTGTPGDAAAGLQLIRDPSIRAGGDEREFLVARFARPDVRVAFAAEVAPLAGAAIDVSDGLFADAGKLLHASGAGGFLEVTTLPRSAALASVFGEKEGVRLALAGGDDYELCFTADPAHEASILELGKQHDVPVACIGEVRGGSGLLLTRHGRKVEFADPGYRHF